MMWMFLLFSLLMIPGMYLYSKNDGMVGLSNYSKAKYTVGNIGFSADNCQSMYLGIDKPQNFSCREGSMKLSYFGLIP
jgi:hypothetical protein